MNGKNDVCGKLKTSLVVFSVYMIFMVMSSVVAADTLFYDGFSVAHPLDSGWGGEYAENPVSEDLYGDIGTGNVDAFVHVGYYVVTKDDAALIASIDTIGYENIVLSYYRRTYSANSTDRLIVEWRVGDFGAWSEIENTYPFDTWTQNTYAFDGSADNEAVIQIRFWLDDGDFDYAIWDDILVTGEPMIPITECSEYNLETDCIEADCHWCLDCSGINIFSGTHNCVDTSEDCSYNGCDVSCGAGCDASNGCDDTECDQLDGCYSGNYRDYNDVPNACSEDCTCENNDCTDYTETTCDDGNVCNGIETCDDDLGCQAGTPLDCDDDNLCTDDSCDATLGCIYECMISAPCDDGNPDTINDVCLDSGDGCICEGTPVGCLYDSDCDDGLYCNGAETCDLSDYTCQAGIPVDCDDSVDCTDDSCDEADDQCVNAPNNANCDDDNICTDDVCDVINGCEYTYNQDTCDDGLWCTVNDQCDSGLCSGSTRDCSDSNECTDDSCDEEQDSCDYQNEPEGTTCGQFRDCPDNYCIDPYLYEYPADGHDYCDGTGSCVVYSCDSTEYECNYNDCNAECDETHPCDDSTCSVTYDDSCDIDGLTLIDYNGDEILNDITVTDSCSNACLDGCVCENCGVDCSEPDYTQVSCSLECPLSESPETSCDDGYDNDCDGNVDLDDTDCQTTVGSTLTVTATPDSVLGNRFYFRVISGSCEENRGRYNTEQIFTCETGSVVKISSPRIRILRYFFDGYDVDGTEYNKRFVKVALDNPEHIVTLEYITLREKIKKIRELFRNRRR